MEQVADTVFALGSEGHNFYLVVEDGEATMIDAGCSGEWKSLTRALDRLGLGIDAVAGLVVTHSHTDHFGLAHRAQSEGIDVRVHRDEEHRALGTYTGDYQVKATQLPFYNIWALRTFLPLLGAGGLRIRRLTSVGTFSHGEQLDLPGHPVAIHTPGHTEGHAMFHLPEVGILFTGDGLITMDVLGPSKGPQMIERRFNHDHVAAWRSLERIVDLDAELLLPGHGPPWEASPAEAIAAARARAAS